MKVAIVNDSRMAVEALRRVLATAPGFTLAWTANSGPEAIRRCADNPPDIILMDLIMPEMDGAETTRRIMHASPCVVLVVTATTVGNRDKVFEAMGHGALDAVNTPVLGPGGDMSGAQVLIQKLRTVSRLVGAPRLTESAPPARSPINVGLTPRDVAHAAALWLVAIGASTGGPHALAEILSRLPVDLPAAILIAQHVDRQFAPDLAAWLRHHSALPVQLARPGELLTAGVWIACTNDHLIYSDGFLQYTATPEDVPYRPSVDILFASLARPSLGPRIGVLLTGMGRDGAKGLLALRESGALTIAQDAASSIVYGMPKAAAELQAADEVLPLSAIGPRIQQAILHPSHNRQHFTPTLRNS